MLSVLCAEETPLGESNTKKQPTIKTFTIMKRKVMNESWLFTKEHKMNRSDALRQGWRVAKVHKMMVERKYVMFEFLKTDGKTIRKAMGTLNPLFIPPVKGLRTPPPSTQVFFDVEKGEWRSFRKANFIRVLM